MLCYWFVVGLIVGGVGREEHKGALGLGSWSRERRQGMNFGEREGKALGSGFRKSLLCFFFF